MRKGPERKRAPEKGAPEKGAPEKGARGMLSKGHVREIVKEPIDRTIEPRSRLKAIEDQRRAIR